MRKRAVHVDNFQLVEGFVLKVRHKICSVCKNIKVFPFTTNLGRGN